MQVSERDKNAGDEFNVLGEKRFARSATVIRLFGLMVACVVKET